MESRAVQFTRSRHPRRTSPRFELVHAFGPPSHAEDRLLERFARVRATTEALCWPLSAEDAAAQSMADASPAKWHLGHTSWFFETFVLSEIAPKRAPDAQHAYLFNSYYESLGAHAPRAARGSFTRPPLDLVLEYRARVTDQVIRYLSSRSPSLALLGRIELGLHHEQQHQELILTDIKHLFSLNPSCPVYQREGDAGGSHGERPTVSRPFDGPALRTYEGGLFHIGAGGIGFAFDNERPRHLQYVEPYALSDRLVTNRDYLEFMADGGYERPELWLSDGWRWRVAEDVHTPLYFRGGPCDWHLFTLHGLVSLPLEEPVCHVSYYEADAFARWAGSRLPTEAEWEHAAAPLPVSGNLLEAGRFHPAPRRSGQAQMFGDVWEWTGSPYAPYPGFQPLPGALGEYNGKFMCNQMVLRGGSCATSSRHIRASYRNFFPAGARWQFSGIRLAENR